MLRIASLGRLADWVATIRRKRYLQAQGRPQATIYGVAAAPEAGRVTDPGVAGSIRSSKAY